MDRSAIFFLVFIVLLRAQAASTLFALSADAVEGSVREIDDAEEKLQLAFSALNEADEIGASDIDVSGLAERLNTALKLLTEAKAVQASGNSSLVSEYASRSVAASDGVREQAEHLHKTSSEALFRSRVIMFALVPIVGLLSAVIFYFVYRARRRPGMEKILRMGIGRKEERG